MWRERRCKERGALGRGIGKKEPSGKVGGTSVLGKVVGRQEP